MHSTLTTRSAADAEVGSRLPELAIPLTVTKIISTAIASRDYQPVHHDQQGARDRGSKDIIMNILTTNGLVGRYVSDWAGPEALIRKISIRLGVSNHPGDTMTFSGEVVSNDGGDVELKIRGSNSMGDHVSGVVRVQLPDPGVAA